MHTKLLLRLGTLALSLTVSFAAHAAMLHPHGVVLINRGNGFERVHGPVECGPNDQVVVNEGSAEFQHANGAKARLDAGQVYDIGSVERQLFQHQQSLGTGQTAHVGQHGHFGGTGLGGGGGFSSTTLFVATGIGAAAGLALIIGRANPSSP